MGDLGTKEQYRNWLLSTMRLTYSAYLKLPAEAKSAAWADYLKSKKPKVSP